MKQHVHFNPAVRAALAASLIGLCSHAGADDLADLAPFPVINHSPFVVMYGIPPARAASVLPAGALEVRLTTALASHYQVESHAGESLTLDGETRRTSLCLRGGFGARLEWIAEFSQVGYSAGLLDGFIENWHDVFHLPQGGRDVAPRDRLLFRYQRDGIERLNVTESLSGQGDLRLGLGTALGDQSASPLALHAELKLPDGDSNALAGSGARDLALSLSAGCGDPGMDGWCYYGRAGLAFLGRGDFLPELQQKRVIFAGAGVVWRVLPTITLKLQLDTHGPLFRPSQLDALGKPALQVAMGGVWRVARHADLEFAVLEDASVMTAPDVTLQVSLRARF